MLVNRAEKLDQMGRLEGGRYRPRRGRRTLRPDDREPCRQVACRDGRARTYLARVRGAGGACATEAVEDLDRAVASIEPLAAGGSDHETAELLADCLLRPGPYPERAGRRLGHVRADIDRAVALESGGDARPKSGADRLRRATDLNSRGEADYFRGRYSGAFENFDMAVGLLRELPAAVTACAPGRGARPFSTP